MQERKVYLLDIASSAFYLANRDMSDRDGRIGSIKIYYSYFPGVQDLIAVLLLNLDSPSLSILVLKQLLRTHLSVFASIQSDDDFYDECDEVSLNHMVNSTIRSSVVDLSSESSPDDTGRSSDARSSQRKSDSWINQQSDGFNFLSLSFFPLLQVLDEELHASLMSSTDTPTSDTDSAAEENTNRILSIALPCGKILQKWMFSWFCCNHSLPIEAVSRIVDFLMASHPFMPLYLSIAFLSDHTNRNRLVLLSQEKSARQDFNLMQDFLFPNQSCDDDCPQSCAMDKIMEFVESSISMSIVFM